MHNPLLNVSFFSLQDGTNHPVTWLVDILRYGNWEARCPVDMNYCSCYYSHHWWTFSIGRPSTQGWPRTLPGPGPSSSPVHNHNSFFLTCCWYCLQWTAVVGWSNLRECGYFLTHLPGHQDLSLVHSRCSILFRFLLIMSIGLWEKVVHGIQHLFH